MGSSPERWRIDSPAGGVAEVRPFRARGSAGGDRQLQNPHTLFPGEEKENAPFDGVREKGSGGGIPDFVRNARGACYGGLARQSPWVLPPVSALDINGTLGPARMHRRPLFAAAPQHSQRRSAYISNLPQPPDCVSKREAEGIRNRPFHQSLPNNQGAAAKREEQGIRKRPQLLQLPYAVEWSKPSTATRPKPP